jgi:hypothetical protein
MAAPVRMMVAENSCNSAWLFCTACTLHRAYGRRLTAESRGISNCKCEKR